MSDGVSVACSIGWALAACCFGFILGILVVEPCEESEIRCSPRIQILVSESDGVDYLDGVLVVPQGESHPMPEAYLSCAVMHYDENGNMTTCPGYP